jgi:hypothetical protein
MLPRLDPELFDWLTWLNGSPLDLFGVVCRTEELTSPRGKAVLRRYATGWCPANLIRCRPKDDCVAVMFFGDGGEHWFHLRYTESDAIFGIKKENLL